MKNFTILFFCMLLSLSISAQSGMNSLRIGAYTGPTFTWMNSVDNSINSNGTNLGLQIGVQSEINFGASENYAFTIGLRFAFNQGGTLRHLNGGNYLPNAEDLPAMLRTGDSPLPPNVDIKYSVNYFEVPLSFKFYTKEYGYWRYFAELPILSLGFRTKATGDVTATGISEEGARINEDMRLFSANLGLGFGGSFGLNEANAITIGLYYSHSLLNIKRNDGYKFVDGARVRDDNKVNMSVLHLRLGFVF